MFFHATTVTLARTVDWRAWNLPTSGQSQGVDGRDAALYPAPRITVELFNFL
jgi:hypothetical protein